VISCCEEEILGGVLRRLEKVRSILLPNPSSLSSHHHISRQVLLLLSSAQTPLPANHPWITLDTMDISQEEFEGVVAAAERVLENLADHLSSDLPSIKRSLHLRISEILRAYEKSVLELSSIPSQGEKEEEETENWDRAVVNILNLKSRLEEEFVK